MFNQKRNKSLLSISKKRKNNMIKIHIIKNQVQYAYVLKLFTKKLVENKHF